MSAYAAGSVPVGYAVGPPSGEPLRRAHAAVLVHRADRRAEAAVSST
ncbi:hypothetical protein ACFWV1_14145 [Streptomyces sp. NPDC058700]